ncbi:hypothetical protein [Streptomyces mirabilis]
MKGVETYSGLRISEVIHQVTGIPFERIAVLSGPNLAREIAGGQAAASVVAPDETAPHDGGRTGAQKAARPSFSCSDLSHVIRGSVSTRCRGTRQVSRREFLSGPLRRARVDLSFVQSGLPDLEGSIRAVIRRE